MNDDFMKGMQAYEEEAKLMAIRVTAAYVPPGNVVGIKGVDLSMHTALYMLHPIHHEAFKASMLKGQPYRSEYSLWNVS